MSNTETTPRRNKRADITDHFPESALSAQATSAWNDFVATIRHDKIMVGSTFKTPDGEHTIDVLAYEPHIVLRGAMKCFHNKHMDSYADPAEVPNALFEVRKVDAELLKGVWSQRGEGGPRITVLAKALAQLSKNPQAREAMGFDGEKTDEECQTALDGVTKEMRQSFAKDPAIKAVMQDITAKAAAERAKAAKKAAQGLALPKLFG